MIADFCLLHVPGCLNRSAWDTIITFTVERTEFSVTVPGCHDTLIGGRIANVVGLIEPVIGRRLIRSEERRVGKECRL